MYRNVCAKNNGRQWLSHFIAFSYATGSLTIIAESISIFKALNDHKFKQAGG